MNMDPTVVLVEQIRSIERNLQALREKQSGEDTRDEIATGLILLRMLETTEPTSVIGASELIKFAADILHPSMFPYTAYLRRVGERLENGQRDLADLIWLRAVAASLEGGLPRRNQRRAALFIRLAICGASKPILIFRAVQTGDEDTGQPVYINSSTLPGVPNNWRMGCPPS
jgi:hypothetical protein